jgi:TolA-binding protein
MAEEKTSTETKVEEKQIDQQTNETTTTNSTLENILGEDLFEYYSNNKKQSQVILIAIGVLIVAFLGYNFIYMDMIVKPKEKESIEKIWQAESKAFDEQDWSSAINGDSLGFFSGFKKISENYSGYSGADVAQYNLGISYLNNREYENAIKTLKKVSFDDELLGTISLGAIGDAFLQLGAVSDALTYYTKAYKRRDNDLTSPLYMMKAALCLEAESDYDNAIKVYEEIYIKYPNSTHAINAEKYMESLKLGSPVFKFETNNVK